MRTISEHFLDVFGDLSSETSYDVTYSTITLMQFTVQSALVEAYANARV